MIFKIALFLNLSDHCFDKKLSRASFNFFRLNGKNIPSDQIVLNLITLTAGSLGSNFQIAGMIF